MHKSLLVTLADKNFVNPAKQLFSSAYFNAGWKGDYMLISVGIPDKELEWFRKKGILVKKCNLLQKNKIGVSKRNPVVLSKFYLFTPEFKKWDNVIFLDSDIIIKASLNNLANVQGFYAAKDVDNHPLSDQFCNKDRLSEENKLLSLELKRNYNLNRPSFNSGVIAFNTKIIQEDSFNRLIALFNKYGKIHNYGDQPTFNLFFYNKWKILPVVYNMYAGVIELSYGRMQASKLKGIIFHIFGEEKPWDVGGSFYNEWKSSLKKAELIDLSKSQKGKPKWSFIKINFYSNYFLLRKNLFRILLSLYHKINYFLGIIGRKIKKFSPSLFFSLKKFQKNLLK